MLSPLMPKILVVDDRSGSREMLGAVFGTVQAEPIFVDSAALALQRYEEGDIDVVLSEVRLPQIDGLVLTRKLKRQDPDAVVILMTALDRKSDLLASIRLGVFDFLVKPFGAQEFADSVTRAVAHRGRLRGTAVAREADASSVPPEPALAAETEALRAELAQAKESLEERESSLREREGALQASLLEFEMMQDAAVSSPGTGASADSGELAAREQALEERENLLSERESFLEESENALMERSQSLQEWATELEHRAEGLGVPEAPGRGEALDPAAAEALREQAEELKAKEKALDERARQLDERERRVETDEALVKAREDYLRQSENILFRRRD